MFREFESRIPRDVRAKIKNLSDNELARFVAHSFVLGGAGAWGSVAHDLHRFAQKEQTARQSLKDASE